MRKRVRILLFVALVAAVVVPVGFALSLDTNNSSAVPVHGIVPVSQVTTTNGPIVATTGAAAVIALPNVPDGAKLFAIGGVLFGLAAAMKRSNRHDHR
jgi:hypothetical protein